MTQTATVHKRIQALLLLLMVAVAYLPSTRNSFIWDDDYYLTHNMTLSGVPGLKAIWLRPGATPQYYPLVFTSFWTEYQLFGMNPAVFHTTNIVLHAANALLVWLILARLGAPGAWLAAALFALHPVNVESVAWVSERKNVLSGLFVLLSLFFLIRAGLSAPATDPAPATVSGTRRTRYMAAFLCFVLALLSKTVACMMPVVFLLLAWWKTPGLRLRTVAATLPFFLAGGVAGLHTAIMEKAHVGAYGVEWAFPMIDRVLIAGRALWFYAYKLIFPANLVFIYPRWEIDATLWWQYLFPVAALTLFVVLWLSRARIGRGPLAGVAAFAVILFPALGFINYYPMRYSFAADHFQYTASIALIALITAGAHRLFYSGNRQNRKIAYALCAGLLLLLGARTWQEQHKYKNLKTLWQDTLAQNPLCWMAHNNLGALLTQTGDNARATAHYHESLRIYPMNIMARLNLANIQKRHGTQEPADLLYVEKPRRSPVRVAFYNGLAAVMVRIGRYEKAAHCYQNALRIDPQSTDTHYRMGRLLEQQGAFSEAIAAYQAALAIDPLHTDAYRQMGSAYLGLKRYDDAVVSFSTLLKIDPFQAGAYYHLGLAYDYLNDLDKAARAYYLGLNIQPDNAGIRAALLRVIEQKRLLENRSPR